MAQEAGADALNISVYGYGEEAPALFPEQAGALLPLAESIKKGVNIPVIAIGAMNPEFAESALKENKVDFIAMGRELLCDPELPSKAFNGKLDDIVPCIHCLNCVDKLLAKAKMIDCAVNATLGRSPESEPVSKKQKKDVFVIGGGPAGLEAARVAAIRGHNVTLFERNDSLGGQMLLASMPPHKNRIVDYIEYLRKQIDKLGIKVEIGKQATPELIQKADPNVVIMATGMTPSIPQIPGLSKIRPVFAHDVLARRSEVGENVAIIGGGIVGSETADFLSEMGRKITIIEILPQIAGTMPALRRLQLFTRLKVKNVTIFTSASCEEVSPEGIVVCTEDGQRHTITADSVVIAVGGDSNNALYQTVHGKIPQVYLVGDAVEPRTIVEAVNEGYNASIML
jgi:NADPH-dependent 2,4-dienoyl-CoA reductase/sulfur reductase-like enzyme